MTNRDFTMMLIGAGVAVVFMCLAMWLLGYF
jgi:hypothetical protein